MQRSINSSVIGKWSYITTSLRYKELATPNYEPCARHYEMIDHSLPTCYLCKLRIQTV
jgi:hypothetical protein